MLKEAITALRDARNKAQIKPKESVKLHIHSESSEATFRSLSPILSRQVNAESIEFTREAVAGSLTVVSGKDKYYIVTAQPLAEGNQKEEKESKKEEGRCLIQL